MGKLYDEIPESFKPWIEKQKVFWVASAPLASDGFVNVSPKGVEGSLRIVDSKRVWYEDLTGSGIETIAHMRENGRITILFNAFDGAPRVVRLFGRGQVYEFGSPEYDELLPPETRQPGSRSIIMVDIVKSCGFGVPIYEFKRNRTRLLDAAAKMEAADNNKAAKAADFLTVGSGRPAMENDTEASILSKGIKQIWAIMNLTSINGLPGLLSAHESTHKFVAREYSFNKDGQEPVRQNNSVKAGVISDLLKITSDGKSHVTVGFLAGIAVGLAYAKYI